MPQPRAALYSEAMARVAKLPAAFEKMDFIPKSDQILHALKRPGRYPYICSFPGHCLVMRSVMVVE